MQVNDEKVEVIFLEMRTVPAPGFFLLGSTTHRLDAIMKGLAWRRLSVMKSKNELSIFRAVARVQINCSFYCAHVRYVFVTITQNIVLNYILSKKLIHQTNLLCRIFFWCSDRVCSRLVIINNIFLFFV